MVTTLRPNATRPLATAGTSKAAAPNPQPKWVLDTQDEFTQIVQQPKRGLAIVATGSSQGLNYLENLKAIDAATGQVKWSVDNAYAPNLPPTVGADGNLYGQGVDGKSIQVRDAKTGQVIRTLAEDNLVMYSQCSEGQNIYSGVANGNNTQGIAAFDKTSGAQKWFFPLHYLTGLAPVEVGGSVFAENGSDLYALDPATGKLKWDFQAQNSVSQAPVVGPNGKLYVVDSHDTVYCLDPNAKPGGANGLAMPAVWTQALDVPIPNPDQANSVDVSSPLAFGPGSITAVATGVSARQLNPDTGAQLWEQKHQTELAAVQGQNGLYAGQGNGILAVNTSDGSSSYWDASKSTPSNTPDATPVSVVVPYAVGKLAGYE